MREGVRRSVDQLRLNGFVTSIGEWQSEINSVGVPLLLHGSQPYALNCGGSAHVLTEARLDDIGRDLVALARQVQQAFGHQD